MKSFLEVTQKFADFPSLSGLAMFSKDGRFIDTSLPFSDELCTQLGHHFFNLAQQYQSEGRRHNRITAAIDGAVYVFAEHATGAFLFLVRDESEVDGILGAFAILYPVVKERKVMPAVVPTPAAVEEKVVEMPQEPAQPNGARKFFWAIPGAAAALLAVIALPSTKSQAAQAQTQQNPGFLVTAGGEDIQRSSLKAKLEAQAIAASQAAEARRLESERRAEERALEEARQAERLRQAEEAELARQREEARLAAEAAEAQRIAAEKAAAEAEKARLAKVAAEKAAAKKAAARRAAAKKAAAKKARSRKSRSKRKSRTHCMND